jgi:hypothetical protein
MVLIEDYKAEIRQSPSQYANERKAQYQAKVRERLRAWQERMHYLEVVRFSTKTKLKTLARTLENKMQEVHDHLGDLESASVGSWEDLKNRIDNTSAYIGKHVDRLNILAGRRDSDSLK